MPISFRNITVAFIAVAMMICPMHTSAHVLLNMGEQQPDPNMPAIPQEKTGEPMADFETQQMALDMKNADCEKLNAMSYEVKHVFFLTTLFLQRPGTLSKIVGPDCQFLGETIELAAITDDILTSTGEREILYHLPKMNALIVSNREEDTVAYGLFIEEGSELQPLEYFLGHRDEAELYAAAARSYAESIKHIVLPIFDPDTAINDLVQNQVLQRSSSSTAKQAVQSRPREVPRGTSSEAAVPTEKTVPPESNIRLDSPPAEISSAPSTIKISDTEVLYVDRPPSNTLPNIQPIGPIPQPEDTTQGTGYWILMIFLALILITTAVIVLRSRASAKKTYQDD